MMQELSNFRENLKTALAAKNITQGQLAERARVTRPYLNRVISGKQEPTLPKCGSLADAIGCPLRDMLLPPDVFRSTLTISVGA